MELAAVQHHDVVQTLAADASDLCGSPKFRLRRFECGIQSLWELVR